MDLRNHAPVSADGKTVSNWREEPAPAAAETSAARIPLAVTLAIFALAFLTVGLTFTYMAYSQHNAVDAILSIPFTLLGLRVFWNAFRR